MEINPFLLERYFAEYEFNVPYLLCASDCEAISVKDLLSFEVGGLEKLSNTWLGYTESQGAPSLRKQIANLYTGITIEDILVFSGAEEAIYIFMRSMFKQGENIIVQSPCYQSLFEVAKSENIVVKKWEMDKNDGWELDIESLETLIDDDTKALIVNFPNNPTGYLPSKEKYAEIIAIAKKYNLLLFSDEVYRLFEYDENDRLTPACELYENAVSLGVMSKSFGLPGLRIGWTVCRNADMMVKFKSYKDYTTICNAAPSEYLAEVGLIHKEKLINRNKAIALENLKLINELFEAYQELIVWKAPKAGVIAFPQFKKNTNVMIDYRKMAKDYGLLLLPGSCYGYPESFFRIGYGRKNFPEALAVFEKFLKNQFG